MPTKTRRSKPTELEKELGLRDVYAARVLDEGESIDLVRRASDRLARDPPVPAHEPHEGFPDRDRLVKAVRS